MENKYQARKPFSNILPILLIALLGAFGMQYFFGDKPSDKDKTKSAESSGNEKTVSDASKEQSTSPVKKTTLSSSHDFRFRALPKSSVFNPRYQQIIDTDRYHFVLSSRGARIQKLYLKSYADFFIPEKVFTKSQDAIEKKYKVLEVSRGEGFDFQFHIYYSGDHKEQLGKPLLNKAAFRAGRSKHNDDLGVRELSYDLNLSFRGKRLKLDKIYRFYEKENYFRQITILRNLENRPINLSFKSNGKTYQGSLFYKTFGDLGPSLPDGQQPSTLDNFGRFFYYNDDLKKRANQYQGSGGGCGFPFACTSLDMDGSYSSYIDHPNTLSFMGSHSRYFLAYNEFMTPQNNKLQKPDGFIYKNESTFSNGEAMTAVFLDFQLGPRQSGRLDIGSPNTLLNPETGELLTADNGNRWRIQKLQNERRDALIIDNKVFLGVRSNDRHAFNNSALMNAAFARSEANPEAEDSLYYSSYTAFFSGISDIIIGVMRWLYLYIGNYGWCIILIALIFKLITFPLNQMQFKGMRKMSLLKPDMDAINEKYAKNPQEKQKHIMQLFKKHNYNPATGCLPVLIQMPVFVALYSAFSSSIELWHSPFILWMTDLSRPDTVWVIPHLNINLNLLPLLMVSSQILYQRYTTVTTDSQQKMMMYFMPLLMLFFFWQIPSGVTLYWTIQNFISIAWQLVPKLFKNE